MDLATEGAEELGEQRRRLLWSLAAMAAVVIEQPYGAAVTRGLQHAKEIGDRRMSSTAAPEGGYDGRHVQGAVVHTERCIAPQGDWSHTLDVEKS